MEFRRVLFRSPGVAGEPPHQPSTRISRIRMPKKMRKVGRYLPERTGELSIHGRKNSSRIEANIASTPHSFAGIHRKLKEDGRASSRERRCQYVEIAGVGANLKKNTKNRT